MGRLGSVGFAALVLVVAFVPLSGTVAADGLPPGWGDALPIARTDVTWNSAGGQSVAVAEDGGVVFAWMAQNRQDGMQYVLMRIYQPDAGMGPTTFFGWSTGTYNQYNPRTVAFPNGSFMTIIESDRGSESDLVAQFWVKGYGWQPALRVSELPRPADVSEVAVAADGQGNAFVIWEDSDGSQFNLTARRYSGTTGWESSTHELEDLDYSTSNIRIVADDGGNAMASWVQSDGTTQRAFVNRYVAGSGFTTAVAVDRGPYDVDRIDVVLDSDGNGVAIIDQFDGSIDRVYANTFTDGVGWGTPEIIDVDTGFTPGILGLVRTGPDSAMALWNQYNGTVYDLVIAEYSAGGGWSTPENLSEDIDFTSYGAVKLAASLNGNVYIAYYDYTPAYDNYEMFMLYRTPAGGWTNVQATTGYYPYPADLSCATSGPCALSFNVYEGNGYQNRALLYQVPDTDPPAVSLSGPTDGSTTDTPTVTVSGTAEPGSTVVVNGVEVHVSQSGGFSVAVALLPGANTIDVTATDAAGNTATSTVTVTYNDPVPGLVDDLAAANGEIDHLHDGLHAANDNLAATNTELNATKADLAAAEADLAAAQAELTAAQAVDTTHTENIDAAAGSAGTAMMVGLLGLIVGLAAIAMAFLMGRKGGGGGPGGGGEASSVPPPAPATPPASEPPKSMMGQGASIGPGPRGPGPRSSASFGPPRFLGRPSLSDNRKGSSLRKA